MSVSTKKIDMESPDSSESNKRAYNFLKAHPVGVLSMVDTDTNPHAVVIYYSVYKDFSFAFTTKSDTKKSHNLQNNKNVMLVVFDAVSQTTVQISGKVRDITNTPAGDEALRGTISASMQTSEAGIPPIEKLHAGDYVAYKIIPSQIRMAVFARPDPGDYEMYETIDF